MGPSLQVQYQRRLNGKLGFSFMPGYTEYLPHGVNEGHVRILNFDPPKNIVMWPFSSSLVGSPDFHHHPAGAMTPQLCSLDGGFMQSKHKALLPCFSLLGWYHQRPSGEPEFPTHPRNNRCSFQILPPPPQGVNRGQVDIHTYLPVMRQDPYFTSSVISDKVCKT